VIREVGVCFGREVSEGRRCRRRGWRSSRGRVRRDAGGLDIVDIGEGLVEFIARGGAGESPGGGLLDAFGLALDSGDEYARPRRVEVGVAVRVPC